MATNYLINVPKLKGRDNYSEWCFAAENFLVLEGMKHCIKPEPRKEIASADDEKTKAKLIMTIDPSLYVHVKTVKSSKELWDKLQQLFDDSGFSRRISLLRNLISIRRDNCSSMTSYVTQIIDTAQKLSGTGFEINDQWTGSLLLAGLPDRFAPMIMAIEHSGISITADNIKTKLLDMESIDYNESEMNGAFVGHSNHVKHNKNNLTMIKKNYDVGSTTIPSKSNIKAVKCYQCKQVGHYKNQCMNNKKNSASNKNKERMQSNAFSAVFLSANFNKNEWYIDSGASVHLTANESWVMNARYEQNKGIVVANSEKMTVLCSGNVKITTSTDDCEYDIVIEDVCCIPSLTTNLLSVSQLIKKGNSVSFTDKGCCVYNKKQQLVATAVLINGVYKVNLVSQEYLAASVVSGVTWHRRLGHVNKEYLTKMKNAVLGMSFNEKVEISKASCTTCCEGKQCRLPFKGSGQRSSNLLDLVHTDICGPMETTSIGGARYFLLFVDDYSRITFVYFLKHKNEALKYFKIFKAQVENQTKRTIKVIRSDNGLEYCNKEFEDHLNSAGIIHQKSNPYTPEQNGLCERFNRTIVEKARCLLFDANLGKEFWGEATNTAVYLQNRTVAAALDNRTPYELWTGTKPDISHIRIFGSTVMVHVAKQKRKKWDKKSLKCILTGYPENIKGYRVYNPETRTVFTSRDVVIIEPEINSECMIQVQDQNVASVGDEDKPEQQGQKVTSFESTSCLEDNSKSENDYSYDDDNNKTYVPSDYEDSENTLQCENEYFMDRPKRTRKPPERYGMSNLCTGTETYDDGAGLTLHDALNGPEKKQWMLAMQEELQCFKENDAWELCNIPQDGRVVQCKWVLRKKYDSDNKVRFRARLVAKGFSQIEGIDYTETFSPVVRHTTLRLLFALSVKLGFVITHLDVTTAFLNGALDETIFMQLPEGFSEHAHEGQVLKLKKAIYGLKQSSRAWYRKVDECLLNIGYRKSKIEPCMYTKIRNNLRTIVTIFVDDFFIFSNDCNETEYLKNVLASHFKLKDLGDIRKCLGVNVSVNKSKKTITLSQSDYIDQVLQKFNMSQCKPIQTPMETKLHVSKGENYVGKFPYQQVIGCLMYLAVLTRPDITYAVGFLSQFNNCYSREHCEYVKRLLRYLKFTKNYGLKYTADGNSILEGYVDADWGANVIDRKSYTGYCFTLSGCVISWETKKQTTVALSSSEAEYMAITEACKEAVYVRNLLYEITQNLYTIDLFNDNQSAQKLTMNPMFHKRTKHIDIKFHFCRECVVNKIVNVKYLPTADMPADVFTKALCVVKHYKFLDVLGIHRL